MNDTTHDIVKAVLKGDATLTPLDRSRVLKALRGEDAPAAPPAANLTEPRVYSRAEAAKLLGDKTPRFVDLLAQRGLLAKVILPGSQRAIGISGASLAKLLQVA